LLLAFSKSLYVREAIDRAAVAYSAHLDARIEENDHDLVVQIDGDDTDDMADHFANHVLFETIRLRQRSEGSA
jgi:hypothetical protein